MAKRLYHAGFTIVEPLLILIVLGIIGFTGWYMFRAKNSADASYTNASKSASSTVNATKATKSSFADPGAYAGWKSYTMQYEKLSLQYPASWTLKDYSTAAGKHDDISLTAADGFGFNFIDGVQDGGDAIPLSNEAVPVTFLGKPGYIVFVHPKVAQADGPPAVDTSTVGSALFLKVATDQESLQADRNVIGSSKYNGVDGPEGSYMISTMGYFNKKNLSIDAAKKDAEYANAKLVVQSMHY